MAKKGVKKGGSDGKTIAIVAYITWVGLIIALILNAEKKNTFAKFHIRQALLIWIVSIIGMLVFKIPVIGWVLGILLFVLWLLGLIAAVQGEEREVPVIGGLAQDWFKGI